MKRKGTSGYTGLLIFLSVILFIFLSIKYIDEWIAINVMYLLRSIRPLHKATENIPDILPYLVVIGTLLMWGVYIYKLYTKKGGLGTQFLKLAATTLPVAYLIKSYLQYMFGRTSPRMWLILHKPLAFNWFNRTWGGSIPSGHMTVFAAFGAAVLIYFPRYRKIVFTLLILLGIALILTDYHYLSDVIAGAYLGSIITYLISNAFNKFIKKRELINRQ